jgi:penicillin-binding protein activator
MTTLPNRLLLTLTLIPLLTGCAAFRQSITETDPADASVLTAKFDQHDLMNMAQQVSADILNHPFPPEGEKAPIMVMMGIQNRTQSHLDMQALADTITTKLMDSGQMRFVDAAQRDTILKEQGFQLANCTEETKVKIGRQLGAKYILSGAFTGINAKSGRQVRVSKKEDVYYQLTITVTDIQTGLIVMRKQRDRLRRASKPLFGW